MLGSTLILLFISKCITMLSSLLPYTPPSFQHFSIHIFIFFLHFQKKILKKMSTIFFLPIFLCFIFLHSTNANYWPISPGYYPSTKFKSMSFYQGFKNLWGPNHQSVDNNGINIWLDRNSGLIFFNYS